MKSLQFTKVTILYLGLVPAVPACAITDIAGSLDAGLGGALGEGGAPGSTGGVFAGTGGDSEVTATGGAATELSATGGAATGGAATEPSGTGGAATGGTKAGGVATGGTTSTGGSTGTTLPIWQTPDGCVTGSENSVFVGTWEGYIQGSPIGEEESSLRLNILGANSSGLCGTVTWGVNTAPVVLPPATDPTEWYPPTRTPVEIRSNPPATILGLAYSIQKGQIAGQRATLEISNNEIYKGWCALQTTYPLDAGASYRCVPGTGFSYRFESDSCSADGQAVACSQAVLCAHNNVCACSAAGCTANPKGNMLDLLFNGNQAMGTLGTGSSVVLNRIQPAP